MMARRTIAAALCAGLLTALPSGAQETADPARQIEARRALMQAADNALLTLEDAAGKKAGIDFLQALIHGTTLSATMKASPLLFPAGTAAGGTFQTTAKAEIWNDRQEFEALFQHARELADQIAAGGSAETLGAATAELRTVCTNCHEAYVAY